METLEKMPDNNIKRLITKDQYKKEQDLFTDIIDTINEYKGEISLVSALGILDLVKDELKVQAKK